MFFHFNRPRRQWKLRYIFVYNGNEVQEDDRFLTRTEAEERFQTMCTYHAKLQQPIIKADLYGPNDFHADLMSIARQLHTSQGAMKLTAVSSI